MQQWKRVFITPLYKGKGSRNEASSYRPVNLCSGRYWRNLLLDSSMSTCMTMTSYTKHNMDSLPDDPRSATCSSRKHTSRRLLHQAMQLTSYPLITPKLLTSHLISQLSKFSPATVLVELVK